MTTTSNPVSAGPTVEVTCNNKPFDIPPGPSLVAKLKVIFGVPECDVLLQVIDGRVVPLDNAAFVDIVGRELFLSQPDSACAS